MEETRTHNKFSEGCKKGERGRATLRFLFFVRFRLIRAIFIFCPTRARLAHYLNRDKSLLNRETITQPVIFECFSGCNPLNFLLSWTQRKITINRQYLKTSDFRIERDLFLQCIPVKNIFVPTVSCNTETFFIFIYYYFIL